MKNVAILTLPLHRNYGGVLQAYAMSEILSNLGYNPYVLKIQGSGLKNRLRAWLDDLSSFSEFKKEYIKELNISKPIKETDLTEKEITNIIVGSDQIWRASFSDINTVFCGFLTINSPIKRIAYAASFGQDYWEYSKEQTQISKSLIQHFTGVSVRENSAVSLCKEYFGINALHVLDPTMLVDPKDYVRFIKKEKAKYIYAYLLDYTSTFNKSVLHILSTKLGKSIRKTKLSTNIILKRVEKQTTIPDWLSNIYNAELVITDSFHGCTFCILFNKAFFVLKNDKGGNARIESLLKLFDLESRLIASIEQLNSTYTIDWDLVNEKLENCKTESLQFLKTTLSE